MYNLDTTYLYELDTENKAYIMGFLLPKRPVNRLKVYLRSSDYYLLDFIKKELKYSGPLYSTPSRTNRKPQTCLSINHKVFTEQLSKFRLDLNFSLLNHFIRGVFDRYGSIIIKGKYLNVTITHDEDFLQKFRDIIYHYGWETKHYYRCDYNNTVTLMLTTTIQAVEFLRWVYKDGSVCLVRKKAIFDDYLESVYNKVDN